MLIFIGVQGYNLGYKIKLDLIRLLNRCFFAIET